MNNQYRLIGFFPYIRQSRPKGAAVVMVAVLLVVLLGCVALAVDIGYLYVARTELQRAADSAALAGAQALGRDADNPLGEFLVSSKIYSQVNLLGQQNTCIGQTVLLHWDSDIKIGYLENPRDLNAVWQTLPLDQCNAVKVIARRDSSNSRGKIPLFFAPLLGFNSSEVSASAIAVLDDRFYAYRGANGMPFTLHVDTWNDEIVQGNGQDNYGYDPDTQTITSSPDGVPEVKLFPNKEGPSNNGNDNGNGNGNGNAGAGNFGILHIGSGSNGVPILRDQIRNGISQDDFVDLTGEPMVKFYEYDSGTPVSYQINGNPGIKAGLNDALQEKTGLVVGFFLHNAVAGTGSNTVFTVVAMRFGRVMNVDLSGSANSGKALIIQPVPQYSDGVLTSPYAPSTDRLIGSVELVR